MPSISPISQRILFLLTALLLAGRLSSSAVVLDDLAYSQPVTLGVNMQSYDLALIRGAHSGWVRITFAWRDINPQPDVWLWGTADAIVRRARRRDVRVLAILSTAPRWAGSNANGTLAPSNIALWESFVAKVAQRYTGRVHAYEIWNEPNLGDDGPGIGWAGNLWASPRYVDYLRAAAIQIRTHAPGTLVVGPVTSSQPSARTVDVFRQLEEVVYPEGPASQYLDVISFHGNAHDDDSSASVLAHIKDQLSILLSRNPSNAAKPIWLTELGWKVGGRVSEASQRDRIRGVIEALTGSGGYLPGCSVCPGPPLHSTFKWAAVFLYKDVDSPDERRGIYREDRTEKPVVTDYMVSLPFPARHPNDRFAPFLSLCNGRTCLFISSSVEPYVSFGYRYHWDFGDGTRGTGRVVSHTFPAAGQYFVVSGVEDGVAPVGSDLRLLAVP